MKNVQKGVNDLATLYPKLVKEWHPTKNGNLKPEDVFPATHRKAWWICHNGHEWEAMVSNRTKGRGCPYCAGQRIIVGENDLATTNPELLKEWDYDKNGDMKPTEVRRGSHKKAAWICKEGHRWNAEIKSRASGIGCPYCSGKKVLSGFNDLETKLPHVAAEWDYDKNGGLTPKDVTYGSGKVVWWKCKNGHNYKMSVDARRAGNGCSVCSKRRRTSFPEQAVYYYVKKEFPDAINTYKDIFPGSMELDVYIPSIKVGIEYDGKVYHQGDKLITDQRKYNICKGNGILLIRIREITSYSPITRFDREIQIPDGRSKYLNYAINNLLFHLGRIVEVDVDRDRQEILTYLTALDKSLMSEYPAIAAEWDYEKNGLLKPESFHPGSNEKVWWRCSKCNHEWKTSIAERTGRDKTGCPECAKIRGGINRRKSNLRRNGSIAITNPELLKRWNYERNSVSPEQITEGSGEKFWWKCDKCGYEWESVISHVKRTAGCPYCNHKVVITGKNDIATLYPELMDEWDFESNAELDPTKISKGSGKRANWICKECGHKWSAAIHTRTGGSGCPRCAIEKRRKKNK